MLSQLVSVLLRLSHGVTLVELLGSRAASRELLVVPGSSWAYSFISYWVRVTVGGLSRHPSQGCLPLGCVLLSIYSYYSRKLEDVIDIYT
jgi:hypothetical protein